MEEKQQSNNPKPAQTDSKPVNSGPTNQQAPLQNEKLASKIPFASLLKRGGNQYNAMPKEQKFTPPPPDAIVENTPLPTQPKSTLGDSIQQEPKDTFPFKIITLVIALILLSLIIIAVTLHYTEYFIYQPPVPIKNFIETFFRNLPQINIPIKLPDLFNKN